MATSDHTAAADLRLDDVADYYDRRYSGSYMERVDPVECRRVTDMLAPICGVGAIVDYGCGRGVWLPVLRHCFPDAHVTAVDVSAVALRSASIAFPGVDFYQIIGRAAPLADASCDLVFSYHVLEHVPDLEATVADMVRLARPGGTLVVALPCGNSGSLEERTVRHVVDGVAPTPVGWRFFFEDPAHLRRLRTEEVVGAFGRHGAQLTRLAYGNHFWGAVHWIARSGRESVREIFDPSRGRSRLDAIVLFGVRSVMAGVARSFAKPHEVQGLLGSSIARAVERLDDREWRTRWSSPTASAQYLVFMRSAVSGRCVG